jgi:exoribonuclease-2
MNTHGKDHRTILYHIARQAILEKKLLPDFSPEALAELELLQEPALTEDRSIRDMRSLLWCSIDNNDSRDLDQLTVAEPLPDENIKVLVAIADVDSFIKNGSAIDEHARLNTTSIYTPAKVFPMLPEKISTDLTSLNPNEDRLAIVIEMIISKDGSLQDSDIYEAWVHSHAKLAYNNVAEWLENNEETPYAISTIKGLAENLILQDQIAQSMKKNRQIHGALSLQTIQAKPIFDGDNVADLESDEKNRAKEIIENFMIAANGTVARFLSSKKFPSIRRIVRTPKRWDRIVKIAAVQKYDLPDTPDPKALEEFLLEVKSTDPERFPDISLSIIKLLGSGEYTIELPDEIPTGHFGLAVKDYTHSTAPNRRYPDLLTQRLLKAAFYNKPAPYSNEELDNLAIHCTETEDIVKKIERRVEKSAAALLLESRIGNQFDSIVTGASEKGTWVRLFKIPVEGKVVQGYEGLDVGDRTRVQLISVDVENGYIDFRNINSSL